MQEEFTHNVIINAKDYVFGDPRKGKQWAKTITAIDKTKTNGYAFEGEFLRKSGESEIEEGSIILSVGDEGSWKHPKLIAKVYIVEPAGLRLVFEEKWENIISIRNRVADLLPSTTISKNQLLESVSAFTEKVTLSDIDVKLKTQITDKLTEILLILSPKS